MFGIYSNEKHRYSNGDEVYIINHVFICEDYLGEIKFNDNEVLEVKWFDINNLPDNIFPLDLQALDDIKKFLETKKTIIK